MVFFKQRRTRHYDSRKRNSIYFSHQIQQVKELKVFTCETRETEQSHLLEFKQEVVHRFQLDGLLLFLFDRDKSVFLSTQLKCLKHIRSDHRFPTILSVHFHAKLLRQ